MRAIFVVLVAGCLQHKPAQVSPQPLPMQVITALGNYRDRSVAPLPPATVERVAQELEARNLLLSSGGEFPALFEQRRTPASRVDALRAQGVMGPALLISCDPRFETQVNGRFRWDVPCDITVFPGKTEGSLLTENISSSAHLVYYHQQEADAVDEVASAVARGVARALDAWLADPSTAPPPPAASGSPFAPRVAPTAPVPAPAPLPAPAPPPPAPPVPPPPEPAPPQPAPVEPAPL